jgi:pimeloyl-ACP methyl ester carboxylesterase
MILYAQNGILHLQEGVMDYIRFGNGKKTLVMLPGVGDGLKTVQGTALPFAMLYHKLIRDFTVYVFSRRRNLSKNMTTEEMSEDLNTALNLLNLRRCAVVGVSQGGMIAQWLAINHPDKVDKLVLTVTSARPNDTIKKVISGWLEMADKKDYKGIMVDTAKRSYSPKRQKTAVLEYQLLGSVGKPKSFERFLIMAEAGMAHDVYEELEKIKCPTLVLGGRQDKIVGGEASEELAEHIPDCELYMYEDYGHGLYEEAKDFIHRVAEFCKR